MADDILKNIWNELSSKGKTDSEFDTWKTNMYSNEEVQNNVYGYLKDNGYTDSEFSDWKTNVLPAKTNDSASADPAAGSENNTGSQSEEPLSAWQSIKNSFSNVGEQVGDVFEFWFDTNEEEGGGARSALDIATNTVYAGIFGQDKVDQFAKELGEDSWLAQGIGSKSTLESIEKFKKEQLESKETLGIIESVKNGDIGGALAGGVNAITSMLGSVIYGAGTLGTGFFMDYTAENFVEYNKLKAENLGISFDELLKSGKADNAIPVGMGAISTALEFIGLGAVAKGAKGAVKGTGSTGLIGVGSKYLAEKLIYNKGARATMRMLSTGATEFTTEILQHAADQVNVELGSVAGTDKESEIFKTVIDAVTSQEGLEAGLQGFIGGGGMVAGTYSAKSMNTIRTVVDGDKVDKNINELSVLRKKFNTTDNKLVKEGIQAQINEKESEIADSVRKGNDIYNSLTDKQISEIESLTDLADAAAFKVTELNKQFRKNEISESQYTLAMEGFKSEYDGAKKALTAMELEKNLEFAKQEAESKGLKFKVYETTKAIQGAVNKLTNISKEDRQEFKDSKGNIHGFAIGNQILINKEVAAKEGAINVGSHEVLHPVFNKLIGNVAAQGKIVKQFRKAMTSSQRSFVDKKMKELGYNTPKRYNTEYINVFSDALRKKQINYDKTTFEKIGGAIVGLFKPKGYTNVSFETGQDVYNFVKEFDASAEQGKLTEKAAAALENVDLSDAGLKEGVSFSKTLTPEQNTEFAADISTIKSLATENAAIAKKFGKEPIKGAKQSRLEQKVLAGIKPLVDKVVTNRTKALYDPIADDAKRNVSRQEFKDSMKIDLETMALNEYNGSQELEKFIVSRGYLRANNLAKRLGIESQEDGGIKADVDSAKNITDTKDEQTIDRSGTVERGQATFNELDIVDDKLISEIELELSKELRMRAQKGTLSEMISVKKGRETYFVSWLENFIDKTLFKKILKKWGAIGESKGVTVIPPGYIDFLNSKEAFNIVTKALPIKTIKKSYAKLFKIEKVGRELTPQGNPIYKIAPTDKKTFLQYFLDGKKNTILERQKQLAREIITPVAKEIVANYSTEENISNLKEIQELAPQDAIDVANKIVIEAQLNDLESKIDRYKGEKEGFDIIQFSITRKDLKQINEASKTELDSADFIKFPKRIRDFIHYLHDKGVITGNSFGGLVYEEFIVKTIKSAARKIPGLKVISNRGAGYNSQIPDINLQIEKDGQKSKVAIEVKKDRNVRFGQVTLGLEDGEIIIRKGGKAIDPTSIPGGKNLIAKAGEGKEFLNNILNLINKEESANFKNFPLGTSISKETYQKVTDSSDYKNFVNLTEELNQQRVAAHYNAKGVYYIQIGGKGLYYMGKDNLNLGVPELSTAFNGSMRFKKGTTKNGRNTISIVSEPKMKGKLDKSNINLETKEGTSEFYNSIQFSKTLNKDFNNIIENATKGSKSRINTNTVPVYHGGEVNSIKDINGFIYFSDDKAQAQEYAKGNYGDVKNFTLKESDIAPEADVFKVIRELDIQPKEKGWTVDDSRLYELIDDRFEQSFNKVDMKKLKAGLKKKGIKASRFTDSDMKTGKDIENIVVFDKSVIQFSKTIDQDFNNIIEGATGIKSFKRFSEAKGKVRGRGKGKYKFFIPPSADDFAGLVGRLLGKGKEGDINAAWFKENLFNPFAKGIRDFETYKEQTTHMVKALKKRIKNVPNGLNKINETGFTNEAAVRVYLWAKNGYDISGLSKTDQKDLIEIIENNKALKDFANELDQTFNGYPEPNNDWLAGTVTTDIINMVNTTKRAEFLEDWQEKADIIFSKENLNKLRAAYGDNYVEALQDMLYRMKTGRNRPSGANKLTNKFMNWVNDSVGTIMFFNTRSALLQTLSIANFINWGDNNPAKAAMAFANQKQFWADFAMLFNSNFLKQRRSGLKNDVNADDIANAAESATNKSKAVLASILKMGFLPTQMADSFAIAMGGASFIRNRINKYVSEGMDTKAAEEQAFLDFQEVAEETQQSSRPDRISQQQASPLGRIILAFANTPMQYMRLTKKAFLDLKNGRGDAKTNISRIVYYTFVQNIIFSALQSALFSAMFEDDDDEEAIKNKEIRIANSMLDSILRGVGIYGAIASTGKNIILEIDKQSKKGRPDFTQAAIRSLDLSPPLSSKVRKLMSAGRAFSYSNVRDKMTGYGLDNPAFYAGGQIVSALTNVPLDRAVKKADNIRVAMDNDTKMWQSIALLLGYSQWDLGLVETSATKKKSKWGSTVKWKKTKNWKKEWKSKNK